MKLSLLPLLLPVLLAAATLPTHDLWSGRAQTLPFQARSSWRLLSGHGRRLAGDGPGPVRLELPPIQGKETATLEVDGRLVARLRIHPERPLEGIAADLGCHKAELRALGLSHQSNATVRIARDPAALDELLRRPAPARLVLFTEKWLFPLALNKAWTAVTLLTAPTPGTLAVFCQDGAPHLDLAPGGIAAVRLEDDAGHAALLLPPDFDFNTINQILLLQKELTR